MTGTPGAARPRRASRSTCGAGHPWTDENTYVDPRGTAQCRACRRKAQARYSDRTLAEAQVKVFAEVWGPDWAAADVRRDAAEEGGQDAPVSDARRRAWARHVGRLDLAREILGPRRRGRRKERPEERGDSSP